MIVGSLAILVALVLLWRSITRESSPETATASPGPSAPTGATSSSTSAGGAARSAPVAPSIARPRSDDSPRTNSNGDLMPNLAGNPDEAAPGTKQNTKGLQFGLPQLRDKIAANAPKVAECIAGSKPTGQATLTFILAQRQGKIVVEQTDVDHDSTTLQDEQLVECLHKTALAMQFDGLPREANAIIVTRSIALQDGAVTEDKPVKFSYLR